MLLPLTFRPLFLGLSGFFEECPYAHLNPALYTSLRAWLFVFL
jgi:hypothetical protein